MEKVERGMERITIIGNSIVDYIEVAGVEKICRRGATLHRMMRDIENREGVKLIVSGIPDIFERGSPVAAGPLIALYERDLERVSALPGVVLCPMYPVRSMIERQWDIVLRLNRKMCNLNAIKGEGTPAITKNVIGRARNGGAFFNANRLMSEAHPNSELAVEMSGVLQEWIENRRRRADLRERIARGQEEERERRQEEVIEIMADAEDRRVVDGPENYEEAMERIELEENRKRRAARRGRQEREEEIKERLERQLARELRENEDRYRRDLDEARGERDEEEDRVRQRRRDADRQEGQQRRGRGVREREQSPRRRGVEREEERGREELPMRCADVRRNVFIRRDYI